MLGPAVQAAPGAVMVGNVEVPSGILPRNKA